MQEKKILILAYFFPPCNLIASERVNSWAKYLHDYGYYPIFITRRWDIEIKNMADVSAPTGKETIHEKNEKFEVYRIAYYQNFRDRIYYKHRENKFVLIRKFLSFFELVFQNVFMFVDPLKNIFNFADNLLKKETDIKLLIVSVSPFILLKYGYLLNKKHHIKWIADYRDEWTSTQWTANPSILLRIVNLLESNSEKKWLKSASLALATSKYSVKNIAEYTKVKTNLLYNGYDEDFFTNAKSNCDHFRDYTIVFNGTLYPFQRIEVFSEAIKRIIDLYKSITTIKIIFAGLCLYEDQQKRVETLLKGYEDNFVITERLPKKDIVEIQLKSNLLLLIAYTGFKCFISAKLLEYIACRKKILFCPSDGYEMEELVTKSNLALICNTTEECFTALKKEIDEYNVKGMIETHPNEKFIKNYTRKRQTLMLAELLNEL